MATTLPFPWECSTKYVKHQHYKGIGRICANWTWLIKHSFNLPPIIIYGFIHYLSNISNVSANAILFKWVYLSIVKTAGNKYYKGIGLPKIILYSNLATFCYNFTFKRLVDLIYGRLINKGGKYLYHGNFENSSNSVPAEEFFIRRNWYAILAEKILWPFVGKCTGGLLLNAFLWIQRKFKNWMDAELLPFGI